MWDQNFFSALPMDSLTTSPEQHDADRAFLASHPERRYRLRAALPGEIMDGDEDEAHCFVLLRRADDGTFHYRLFGGNLDWSGSDEVAAYCLWTIWALDTGGEGFSANDIGLLAKLGQLPGREPPPKVG